MTPKSLPTGTSEYIMKPLHKDEDLRAIPLDQPVLVDLEPDSQEPVKEKTEPKAEPKPEDDGVNVLKEQLRALQEANRLEREQRIAAQREADEAKREREAAVTSRAKTEEEAIQSGLSAAQAEQASAKAELKSAFEAGDAERLGEAQARIGRSAADIREFERAAAAMAERKEQAKAEPRQAHQAPQDINAIIDGNPQLLPAERDWLKQHPEAMIDASRNKELEVAYIKATRKGLSRGTPDYFKFMDAEMGYAQPDKTEDDVMTAAPVSRNERGADGRPSSGKVNLTPEMREIAKSMGITDTEYARQVQALETARSAEPEKYR